MMDYLLGFFAVVAVGAYVCRVDELSWWRTPWLMLLHAGGGITSTWVLYYAAVQEANASHALALAGAVVLLLLTLSHLPSHRSGGRRRREAYHTGLMVSGAHIGRSEQPLEPLDRRHDDC